MYLKLSPKLAPAIDTFLQDRKRVFQLAEEFKTPLNVVFPEVALKNAEEFRDFFESEQIPGIVAFAAKSNKSDAILRTLAQNDYWVDVASLPELEAAINAGFRVERIEASGIKNSAFLRRAIQLGVLIGVDGVDELLQLIEIHRTDRIKNPIRILARLSSEINVEGSGVRASKFGFSQYDVPEFLSALEKYPNSFSFEGVSFHHEAFDIRIFVKMVEQALALIQECTRRGSRPKYLNIGGGFPVRLLKCDIEHREYLSALKNGVAGLGPSLTWNGFDYGLRVRDGKVMGEPAIFNVQHPQPGVVALNCLLSAELPTMGDVTIGRLISDMLLELIVEPGKAITANSGFVIADVISRKLIAENEWLISLGMNESNLGSRMIELFIDPIVISKQFLASDSDNSDSAIGCYFGGNTCFSGDLIYKHKTFLTRLPTPGDLIVFPNSAAYCMDFMEGTPMRHVPAKRIAVWSDTGTFSFELDESKQKNIVNIC